MRRARAECGDSAGRLLVRYAVADPELLCKIVIKEGKRVVPIRPGLSRLGIASRASETRGWVPSGTETCLPVRMICKERNVSYLAGRRCPAPVGGSPVVPPLTPGLDLCDSEFYTDPRRRARTKCSFSGRVGLAPQRASELQRRMRSRRGPLLRLYTSRSGEAPRLRLRRWLRLSRRRPPSRLKRFCAKFLKSSAAIESSILAPTEISKRPPMPPLSGPLPAYRKPSFKPGTDASFVGLSGGQIFHEMMLRHDVRHVFGYPGGAILPVFDAIYNSSHFNFVLPRHEQGAGHMAEGYARAT
ncbi:MAG: hypothetical protein BJ554DRAFT_5555 [Olpidium bornovanus]|uniref:Thiamine pyrophosphate enzyme N-terminal TPP-binding domain-containing protein n=1 Tax=Olpidium bornovanus TaxID=278681 RepID=A0A8H7ZZ77_9FUNG|nr:MAG: hypothetical protein BJ554DRAFT_5555 [Olpidium bornovanus]